MKLSTFAVVAAALLGGAMFATAADARGYGYGYHHHSSVGIYFGVPGPYYYRPYYYPPYAYYPSYYYPPVYGAPAPAYPPAAYIEQSAPAAAPGPASSSGSWYYCRDTQTYYPYVQQCASPWQQVAPNSAPRS